MLNLGLAIFGEVGWFWGGLATFEKSLLSEVNSSHNFLRVLLGRGVITFGSLRYED